MYQHVVYGEYLPTLLGENATNYFKLKPLTEGYTQYNEKCNPSAFNEFAAACFRFGHSMVTEEYSVYKNSETIDHKYDLKDNYFHIKETKNIKVP